MNLGIIEEFLEIFLEFDVVWFVQFSGFVKNPFHFGRFIFLIEFFYQVYPRVKSFSPIFYLHLLHEGGLQDSLQLLSLLVVCLTIQIDLLFQVVLKKNLHQIRYLMLRTILSVSIFLFLSLFVFSHIFLFFLLIWQNFLRLELVELFFQN